MICSVKGLVLLLSKTRYALFREPLSMPGEKSPHGVSPSSARRMFKPSGFGRSAPESYASGQRRNPATFPPREQPRRAQTGGLGSRPTEEQAKAWQQGHAWNEWMTEGPPGGHPWDIPRQRIHPEWFGGAPHYLQMRPTTGATTDYSYPPDALGHFWPVGSHGAIPWGWHTQQVQWRWHHRTQLAAAATGAGLHIHTLMGPEQQAGPTPAEGSARSEQQQQVQHQSEEEQWQQPQGKSEPEQETQQPALQQMLWQPNPVPPQHVQGPWYPHSNRLEQQQERAYQPRSNRKPLMEIPEAAGRRWMPVGGEPPCEVPLVYPGPPPPTNFQTAGPPPRGTPVAKGHWRLMSFNILAESLVDEKYSKQDPEILAWPRRQKAILDEINLHSPSVVCLQELEECHLPAFKEHLREGGYSFCYKRLTSKTRVDGCAIFWQTGMFRLVDSIVCEFNFRDGSIMDKDQVAVVVLLEEKAPNEQKQQQQKEKEKQRQQQQKRPAPRFLVVANTHLIFSPMRGDIKLAQLLYLFRALHEMRLKAILRAYEALTNAEGTFSIIRSKEEHDATLNSPAHQGRTTGTSESSSKGVSMSNSDQGPSPAGEGVNRIPQHSKSLACPGADKKTLKETLLAWAAEQGDVYKGELEHLQDEVLKEAEALVHVAACGDFNFTPQSPLYHLVVRRSMDFTSLSKEKISGQFLMSSKIYPIRSPGHCFAGASTMNTPETSRVLTQKPKGSVSGWEKSVMVLFRRPKPPAASAPLKPAGAAAGAAAPEAAASGAAAAAAGAAAPGAAASRAAAAAASTAGAAAAERAASVGGAAGITGLAGANGVSGWHQQQEQQDNREAPSAPRSCNRQQPPQHQEEPFLVTIPFALKSAYAIAPTDPHWLWRLQKRAVAGPHRPEDGPFSALEGLWGLAASPPGSNRGNGTSITVGEFLEEPAYTAFHGWQKGCIDYIFFIPSNLKVVQVYQLPNLIKQGRVGSCPNELWPASDHLSLVADFLPTGDPCTGGPPDPQASSGTPGPSERDKAEDT